MQRPPRASRSRTSSINSSKKESSPNTEAIGTKLRRRNLVEGTIVVHRDGYGFVIPKEKIPGIDSDIFIPACLIGSAMNGDKVKVEITLRKAGGRAEGRVVSVEKRARETIVGQLRFDGEVFFVAPMDEKLPSKILIVDERLRTQGQDRRSRRSRVFRRETRWPAGKIVSVIGFIDDPNVETNVIIKKFGLADAVSQGRRSRKLPRFPTR